MSIGSHGADFQIPIISIFRTYPFQSVVEDNYRVRPGLANAVFISRNPISYSHRRVNVSEWPYGKRSLNVLFKNAKTDL